MLNLQLNFSKQANVQAQHKHNFQLRSRVAPIKAATDLNLNEDPNKILQDRRVSSVFTLEEFKTRTGEKIKVLAQDLGFKQGVTRLYQDQYGQVPLNLWQLGTSNFQREFLEIRKSFRFSEYQQLVDQNKIFGKFQRVFYQTGANIDHYLEEKGVFKELDIKKYQALINDKDMQQLENKVRSFKLDDQKINDREKIRIQKGLFPKDVPFYLFGSYRVLCFLLDLFYANKPIQRFWVLETVARMPYFAAISLLHLYETFGWWRAGAVLRRIHFAEDWNELHHLQIMETLGGDRFWFDRFLGEHTAIIYYWILIGFYMIQPKQAYMFSEMVECHAVDTYSQFCKENKEVLKSIPPPLPAVTYYLGQDVYMFDEFQTGNKDKNFIIAEEDSESGKTEEVTKSEYSKDIQPRRPGCKDLYETFINIRDDENEHVKTMNACREGFIINNIRDKYNHQN